jgi:uncharacterized protein YdcH (DUF465 family)
MSTSPEELRRHLLASNDEFQRLAREHSKYESQLEQLVNSPYFNSEDLILQTELKKMKLKLKDQMERIVLRHQHNSVRA